MSDIIMLAHGDGGALTHKLVQEIFLDCFNSNHLNNLTDAATLGFWGDGEVVVSTDSFVVSPMFFPGGDIGKLAVCGTVNDIAVSGGIPQYLTAAFILEEGLLLSQLKRVVKSMVEAAREGGVEIIAGDTKVVEKGHGDKLFINTTGIGYKLKGKLPGYHKVSPGDKIVINGTVGDHGLTIINLRQDLGIEGNLTSDCASLNRLIEKVLHSFDGIRIMRDPTRGGLATTLKEIAKFTNCDFIIYEDKVPVQEEVGSTAEMLGLDPLYLANEGKFISIIEKDQAEEFVKVLRENPLGKKAEIIGEVKEGKGKVLLKTFFGGTKSLNYMTGAPLPRIC